MYILQGCIKRLDTSVILLAWCFLLLYLSVKLQRIVQFPFFLCWCTNLTNMKCKWFQLQCVSSVMDCTNNPHFVYVGWKASSLSGEFWTPARFSECHLHNLYSGIFGITFWALEEMCMIMDRNCIEPEKLVSSFLFLELAHTKIHQPISLEDHRLNLIWLI